MARRFVKPYVKGQKNDAQDGAAIFVSLLGGRRCDLFPRSPPGNRILQGAASDSEPVDWQSL